MPKLKKTQPEQPIILMGRTPRFQANAIVRWLVDSEIIDLNDIDISSFSPEDLAQFWQLLGYSVSGYGELSFIPRKSIEEADVKADSLLQTRKAKRAKKAAETPKKR